MKEPEDYSFIMIITLIGISLFLLFSMDSLIRQNNVLRRSWQDCFKTKSSYKVFINTKEVPNCEVKKEGVPPNLSTLRNFLRMDTTDSIINYSWDCEDYTNHLLKDMLSAGLVGCHARLDFVDGMAHAIVAVNTSDDGVVFVEPQTDKIFNLSIGDNYYDKGGLRIAHLKNWKIKRISSCYYTKKGG